MAEHPLPAPIQAFVDATNAADSDAFVAAFTDDAVLSDWGRVYHGREGIAEWDRTDNIGKKSHFEVVDVTAGDAPDSYVVTLSVSGDGYNGASPITFELVGNRIARVEIAPD
ncbi:nuclear transport factor 2 family protein [Microbacterium sp. RD1]|uniref:nuclear transport factor 2 family protein n=1 Tax=Microbacterium sp. RD1 TaxID=3457313 RepID=UPI003FA5CB7F